MEISSIDSHRDLLAILGARDVVRVVGPPLLRTMYLFAERQMMSLARMLVWAAVLLFVVTVALVGVLLYEGILPLRPR